VGLVDFSTNLSVSLFIDGHKPNFGRIHLAGQFKLLFNLTKEKNQSLKNISKT
jgi:hypothetical protein